MPHITGITKDGHQNNWWKYWFSLNYVDRIKLSAKNVSVITGSTVTLKYTLQYALGNTENKTLTNGNNVSISDRSILDFVNGTLKAKKAGTAKITVKHDGIPVTYTVTVADKKEESPKPQPSNNTQPQPDNNTQPELDDEQPIEEDAEDGTTPEEDGDDDQNEEYTEDEEYYEEIDDDGSIIIRRKENVEETEEDDEEKPKDFVQFLIIFGTIVGSLVILAILIALIISYNRNAIKP